MALVGVGLIGQARPGQQGPYVLESNGGNTRVRITEDGQVYNPMFRFMSRVVVGQTRTIDTYLRALGKAIGQEGKIKD